jgi:hypothetical protein
MNSLIEVIVSNDRSYHLACHIDEESMKSSATEKVEPAPLVVMVCNICEEDKHESGNTASDEDIRSTPNALIDRKPYSNDKSHDE